MDLIREILLPVGVFIGLGAVMGVILAIASRLFRVEKDEKAEAIALCLPGANCGGCGYTGCSSLAEAIAAGKAKATACTVGGDETAKKIADIMGIAHEKTVRMRAQVMCSGTGLNSKKKYIYKGANDCVSASKIGGGDKLCPNGCLGLGTCVSHCPFNAIKIVNGIASVDHDKCRGCGVCVSFCPKNVIRLIPFDSKQWVGCVSNDAGKTIRSYCDAGCISCRICEKNCESRAITVDGNIARIDYDKCSGCGICAEKCPRGIIYSAEKRG